MDRKIPILLLLSIGSLFPLFGQTAPNLEFATASGDGNPTGNGPVTSTVISFNKNTNNPGGDTFSLYAPQLKATFTISNMQYNSAASIGSAINNASAPIFPLLNSIGSPANNNFTSSGASTGTGINTGFNRGIGLFVNSSVLSGQSTNGTYQMADLVITFNRPVDNPILHIGGMGGVQGSMGLTAGFEYVSSNIPVTFSRLSGNSNNFMVTSTTIHNTAPTPSTSGANSGSGSVLVTGKGITSLTLRLTMRGSGQQANWQSGTGDQVMMGISLLESNLSITKSVNNPTPKSGTNVIFTLTAQNSGASNNTNVKVTDQLPDGYTFINASTATGSYNNSSGVWTIGNLNDGSSTTLDITTKVNYAGNYTNTANITGDINDPDTSNNSSSSTPNVQTVCYEDKNSVSAGINSKFGITTLKRAGNNTWPTTRNSAHMVLESNNKGFVITRIEKASLGNITNPVEGMIVYDLTDKCLKVFADGVWSCFSKPTCP
ncbi:hypothetical protein C1637_20805 [Chryseobacterium lactis]|uniref:DUF11 domain-containing protein n=1 Tax=Chryseobacterium lactis TaxID=1241981 RepID=A0A3G6RGM6_CHRLC|nr:DUF11 domain-containing protein [Chryseobacterium lactis]AZA82622.1 DUF11 domain-containing protein [Chryseobacterium lactis]AZB03003.1 DUF11 domain-containing protein [Chryseobacterium lactis]PNW11856.1 hypothetical protein C1637_20805 [Chryseobacterium lactis]